MKKGFTLIELLAVIVILSIIALIATPLVINIIDEAKKGAFVDSAYGIARAGEIGYTQDVLDGTNEEVTFTYTDGVESSSVSGKTLNYKGTKPQNGKVIVNDEGKVALAIHDGTYCAVKHYNESKITASIKEKTECIIPADISGASAPELTTGMIPVTWDGTNWIKANSKNELGDNEWYNYDSKIWANAVTVTSDNRDTYINAELGTAIAMTDINTMWVWIPRYKYGIPTGTGPREINIVFESKNIPKSSGDATESNYLTHPAFTFGTEEVEGIWVGKFETTGTIDSPTILPNVSSIRGQTVRAMYDSSKAMENNNIYGNSTDGDIHMMKNSDWGAVAYLSHSRYGINEEIWINNSSTYTTGCSGNSASASSFSGCQNQYHTTAGVNASTTGNIYGIYDMSGGAHEYVMGMYRPTDATSITDNSGFGATTSNGSLPSNEYWDRYTTTGLSTACDNGICYGDALSETDGWYNEYADFVSSNNPWLIRGDMFNAPGYAGIFRSNGFHGGANSVITFRLIQIKS